MKAVAAYFALAFAISWGGVLFVAGFGGLPVTSDQLMTKGLETFAAMPAGPCVAGLLITGLVYGRAGLREMLTRLLTWRVPIRWYAIALLTAPVIVIAVSLALSTFMTGPVLSGIAMGLIVGIFEEIGWTGFAVPRLRRRLGMFGTGLLVGVLWGAWHFVMFWEPDSFSGATPFALLFARLFAWLPAYRVLMVWAYDRTGSLLLAMLMHASLTATQLIVIPPVSSGTMLLISILALSAALWIVVGAVVAAGGSRTSRKAALIGGRHEKTV